jgi:hypothetical protein
MKNIHILFSAAVCGLVLAFTAGASAQDIKQGVATVVRVQGEASYTLGGNDGWHPLVVGKILQAGSSVKTEADALVDVVLGKNIAMPQAHPTPDRIGPAADSPVRGMVDYKPSAEQNVVRLSGDTTLKIDTLTVSDTGVDTVSDTELNLQQGRIFYSVKKLSTESKYFIKVPNGIAGVRGSQGFISVAGNALGTCGALVHPLWISIIGPDGKVTTLKVEQGQQFDPGTGQNSPLSPEFISLLQQIATAAKTCYVEVVSVAFNRIELFVSSTTGHHFVASGGGGEE